MILSFKLTGVHGTSTQKFQHIFHDSSPQILNTQQLYFLGYGCLPSMICVGDMYNGHVECIMTTIYIIEGGWIIWENEN